MRKELPVASSDLCSVRPRVGEMFDRIAPTYDLLNHLLSLGRDCAWRRSVAGLLGDGKGMRVADLATGTGDLLIAVLRRCPGVASAVGVDISERMLDVFREKLRRVGVADRVELVRSDASATPFANSSLDAVTMAFGIRNTNDVGATLQEIHRVLKPGGTALILEFSLPANRVVRWCHRKYLRFVVPSLGALVSRDRHAYRYLHESIERFCRTEDLASLMKRTGFREISTIPLTFGVASIYRGRKEADK